MNAVNKLTDAMSFTWPVFDAIHTGMARLVDERALADGEPYRYRYNWSERRYEVVDPDADDDADKGYAAGAMAGVAGSIPFMFVIVMSLVAMSQGSIVALAISLTLAVLSLGALGHWFDALDTRVYTEETEWMLDA